MNSLPDKGDIVRGQYEAYPYPARDPRDEDKRLVIGSPSYLPEIEHYIFAGALPAGGRFRALVAGGGTGDAAIMLAQLLMDRGIDAEITYLDLSQSSRRIAEARAQRRGLKNILFITATLESLNAVAPGPYDYIDCCGVLHHLADPLLGLRTLVANLSPVGGMGLMLYGTLGRTGIYPMQAMLRTLAGSEDPRDRLPWAKRLLKQLPPTNWLLRNQVLGDFRSANEAELYDVLLHQRDRSYDVDEIFDLTDQTGLKIVQFMDPWRYDPASYINDPKILSVISELSFRDRCAFAEKLTGNMKVHVFYAVPAHRIDQATADPVTPGAVPVWYHADDAALLGSGKPLQRLTMQRDGITAAFPLPPTAPAIFKQIDGIRNFDAIAQAACQSAARPGEREKFKADALALYGLMNRLNKMFLRVV